MLRQKSKEDERSAKQSKQKSQNQSRLIRGKDHLDESKQEVEPSMLEYNLKKLLAQSAERQQKYINFIKEQKEQIYSLTQKYSEVMARYEKQIKEFITKKESERKNKIFEKVHQMLAKGPPNKYNKKEYTKQMDYEINCKIKFLYLIGIVQDYLKQTFPRKFHIEFTQYYPVREQKSYAVQFNPEIDKEELVEYMKMGNSIQILLADMNYASYNFTISHFNQQGHKILKYYRENQLQINLRNQSTQLLFGYGKIDLEQLLQFNQENQQSWIETVPIVSMEGSDKIIAYIHVQMSNSATQRSIPQQHIHKISEPISLDKNDIRLYGDKESRLIHRINQYKNLHTKVIPQSAKQSADKNILMHQKRKQLQQIEQYKQANKGSYMEKVFEEAIQQYHSDYIEVGQCKYVNFVYTNHTDKHQRAKISIRHSLANSEGGDNQNISLVKSGGVAFSKVIEEQKISIQIVSPQHVPSLLQQRILEYPPKTENCTFDYVIDNDYAFVMNGQSILIFVKVILHSLASIKCHIQLEMHNDFGQSLHSDMIILRSSLPVPTHSFPLYTYVGQVNKVKAQIPSYSPVKPNFDLIGKAKIANIVGCQHTFQFENNWTENYQILQLKITASNKVVPGKTYNCYLFVYDVNYTYQLASFQFNLECTDKLEDQIIQIGRTQSFNFKFKLPPVAGSPQKIMLRLGSSDYLQGCTSLLTTTQKSKQFLAEPNVEYQLTLNYNTFAQLPETEKLVISMVDTNKNISLKKLAIILKKSNVNMKQPLRLICPVNKVLLYDFDLYCNYKEQTIYKLYSSNYSLMTISQETPVLFTGQNKKVKLEFRYWKSESTVNFNSQIETKSVILAVDDSKTCTLHPFNLEPERE